MHILFSVTTVLLLLLLFKRVSATNEIRFIFNNGFSPSQSSGCFESELIKLDELFGSVRRHLRTSENTIPTTNEASPTSLDEARHLTTLRQCANICEGYSPGSCRKYGCKNFRALSVDNAMEGDRNLQVSCTDEVNAIHTKLDNLRNTVSTSCKNFLEKSKRSASCFADYQYGQIQGLRVWNQTSTSPRKTTVVNPFVAPGGTVTICNNVRMVFEALNEPCVDDAHLLLVGPNYREEQSERISPYTLFGDDGTNFQSEIVPNVGTYNLTITPDSESTKKKVFKIVVKKC